MLLHIGFYLSLVNWIQGSLSYVSFNVLINGSTYWFSYPKGIETWVPPFTIDFSLGIRSINSAIKLAKRISNLRGIKRGRSMYLSHMLFVDDVLLFSDSYNRDAILFKEILDLCSKASRIEINFQNSSITYNNISEDQERSLSIIFPYKTLSFSTGFK
jgi:hypothetical protein